MKALVWPVATYGCESWTVRKNEETRLDVFEMKGLRKILRVSWTAKKTNEWVLNKAGVKTELLDTVKARKLWPRHEETLSTKVGRHIRTCDTSFIDHTDASQRTEGGKGEPLCCILRHAVGTITCHAAGRII